MNDQDYCYRVDGGGYLCEPCRRNRTRGYTDPLTGRMRRTRRMHSHDARWQEAARMHTTLERNGAVGLRVDEVLSHTHLVCVECQQTIA